MFLFASKNIIPKSVSTALIIVLFANLILFAALFQPQTAQAQWTDIVAFAQRVAEYVWEAAKFVWDKAVKASEAAWRVWDQFKSSHGTVAEIISTLFLVMMHQVLAKLTNDIVAWINGGGKGKIRVLQDPGKFLTDALDEAGGVLAGAILNVDPATLCDASYLKFKLKAAFTGPFAVPTFDEKVACTFTGAMEGLQKFQEDFTNGGWESFIELSRKENNQLGQGIIVAEEMARIKSEKSGEAVAKLNISKGFLAQEKCTITKAAQWRIGDDQASNATILIMEDLVGKSLEEAQKQVMELDPDVGDINTFKKYWIKYGGEVACKTVTPAEQISGLASNALQAPIRKLEASIIGLTTKLGTGAGDVLKPYVLAIANAGLNLLLNKGIGLITNAVTPSKKTRKARRQPTSSLQENTVLAQSAGALAGSANNFRSFLLNAMLEFSLYVGSATAVLNEMDVLGRIPLNKGEIELLNGTWYLGGGCPAGYDQGNLTTISEAPYSCAYDPNAITTNHSGKIFFEEANWCGAYHQEIPMVTEDPPTVITAPVENPRDIAQLTPCSRIVYFQLGTGTETAVTGVCNNAADQVTYNLDGDADYEIITQLAAYNDTTVGGVAEADRFIRKNYVGADTDNDGIPDADASSSSLQFEETLVDTKSDVNFSAVLDGFSVPSPASLAGLFEMRPYYTNAVTTMSTGATSFIIPQGLAQAAVAGNYIFGGYNQFGHSSAIRNLSTGAFVASLPTALSGSAAVYNSSNGRIYLFGGFDSAQAYATIWEFNPANNAIRTMSARLPAPAAGLAAAYYPPTGRTYLFGGATKNGPQSWVLEYNQTTDSLVTKTAAFSEPVAFAAAATASKSSAQRIYVFGGILDNGRGTGAAFTYDPTASDDTSALTRTSADLGEARGYIAAANASASTVTLAGGQNEYGLRSIVEQYDAQTDSFTQMTVLPEPRSKAAGGVVGGAPVLVGGVTPVPVSSFVNADSEKIFPRGDIYYIPAAVQNESITSPVWQKYFSSKFDGGSAILLNTRETTSYGDFTATIGNTSINSLTNTDSNLIWMYPPFYPELFEEIQELMEKTRVINGYNYPPLGVKNYYAGLADQLGMIPDDDPYDNSPSNPYFFDNDADKDGVIEQPLGEWEGYKGSVTDVLTLYNDLTQAYQTLFTGITDENALEGVDKDMKILSPEETNIKLALTGSRCPALPPSATSTPDLVAKCPKFGDEYNMARRFVFEADDTGANPTGLTTGFATNPFTGEKSSSLAGLLNLEEMATQLQSLPPDKNIIKLIRLRQLLEQLQIWKSSDPLSSDYQKSIVQIPVPGKTDVFIEPKALTGVDVISVSLPGYEKIQTYLNATSTVDELGNTVPDKNRSIQTLIEDYGYTSSKDAYPEISKQLDDIFNDIITQVTDDVKETFMKRIEEQLEEALINAQHRLQRFVEYVRDINGTVKLGMSKQRGDQLTGLPGVDVAQTDEDSSVLRVKADDVFSNNSQGINALLSRSPVRLTNEERNGIIGSAIYKIKTMAKFAGADISSAEFQTQTSQYVTPSGDTLEEREASLDQRVKNALKDVYMYYTGVFSQTDETLSLQKRNISSTCGYDDTAGLGYYCNLTTLGANFQPVKIIKDARMKLEDLINDFAAMTEETAKISEEYNTLINGTASKKQDIEELVKLLSALSTDYDQGNACVGIPVVENWSVPSNIEAAMNTWFSSPFVSVFLDIPILGGALESVILASVSIPGISSIVDAIGDWLNDDDEEEAQRERARQEAARQAVINNCIAGINNYNKHLGQLADTFLCNKTNPKYE